MPVSSSAELRETLRTAKPGQIIDLAPGEYHGPFVIGQAVRLRGLGRRTVLWRHAGPVIYVRSEGVRLERLLFERTVLSQGPLVVHDAGCVPTGKESMELDGDALINLGELIPGATLTLSLPIEITARTEIMVTGLHGAQVNPAVLETPGKHFVTLVLDGKAVLKGELLLGEITLHEGETTRYLWLSGLVLESPPPERQLCLVAKKTHLYPSENGLVLDGAQLAALEIGRIPVGKHAIIQRDPLGNLSIYLPEKPPSPVLINGVPAAPRSRKLLSEQDTIQVGDCIFGVQTTEPLPIELETSSITFPDFDSKLPDPVSLSVRTLKGGWRGQVISAVPWLSVTPEGYFRVPPSRTHTWTVTLNQEALVLDDGLYEIPGGLLIVGANQAIGVDVRIKVERPRIALQVAQVDMGAVELGWRVDHTAEVSIVNLGRAAWSGEVKANVPWLQVVTPGPVGGEAWSEVPVQVRLVPAWETLTGGEHVIPDGLLIVCPESDPQPVPVRIEVTAPRGHLNVFSPQVTFEEVERNTPLPEFKLPVRNDGGAPWTGQVQARHGWVQPEPSTLELAAGGTAEITVKLLDIPADQPLDEPFIIDEIRFEGTGESISLPEPVPVELTVVEYPPYLVARPVNFPPFVRGDTPPDGILRIQNMGPTAWEGKVTANNPSLGVPDRVLTCEPDTTLDVHIGLTGKALETLKVGISRWENALSISGGREPVTVSVQVDLRDAPVELHLETPSLNFGQVNGSIADIPPEMVRLLNGGPTPWKVHVQLALPWVSFESLGREFDMEVPGMSVVEFKVLPNDQILTLPPGGMNEENAILITGHTQRMSVRVMAMLNEVSPWLGVAPERLVLKDKEPQRLVVSNEGARRWTLQINAVPWLEVAPVDVVLNAGQSQVIEVRYHAYNGAVGPMDDPRAIVIVGPGREVEVAAEVTAALVSVAAAPPPAEPKPLASPVPEPPPSDKAPSEPPAASPDVPPAKP